MQRLLLITSCAWPIEEVDVTDPGSHFLFIFWTKLYESVAQSHVAVSAVGTCMAYDGVSFEKFPAVREV